MSRVRGPWLIYSIIALATSFGLGAISAAPALAQGGNKDWIIIDSGFAPGSSPSIIFNAGVSNEQQSIFDISIPGFWSELVTDTSGAINHQKIRLPGHGTMHTPGAPKLPVIRLRLAVVTDASALSLLSYTENTTQNFSGYYPWPDSEPQQDHPEGEPEGYELDTRIYTDNAQWPTADFDVSATPGNILGSIKGVVVELYPFKINPVTQDLEVVTQVQIGIGHPGTLQPTRTLTKERVRLAAKLFDNWPSASNNLVPNDIKFEAEYLIIYASEDEAHLQPLIDLKKARGLRVTKMPIQPSWATCNQFRGAIQNWYNATDPDKDHYCLLVGDDDKIPLCISPPLMTDSYPGGVTTDDLYGSIDGDDLNEEIFVGRISYDDTTELKNQIDKIVAYQTTAFPNADYNEVLLVAHQEDAPEKYEAAHESVRNAFYVKQPTFLTRYGSDFAFGTNIGVRIDINDGVGVVAYRGHGSATAWTGWHGFDNWEETDINLLNNDPFTPVIFSFACQNGRVDWGDCLGELFMEKRGDGAVAFYASTSNSYTEPNHELNRQIFQGVYTVGLTTISHAIQFGEMMMTNIEDFHNAWMYLLLGDPDMEIRRGEPSIWTITGPPAVPPCDGGCPPLNLTILDDQGQPLEGVLVAAWKEGFAPTGPGGVQMKVDELLDNRYTNASGQVQIPVSFLSEGTLFYTVQDESGDTVLDSIRVGSLVDVPKVSVQSVSLRARPNIFQNETFLEFGSALPHGGTLEIYSPTGRLVNRVDVAEGERGFLWKGTDSSGARLAPGVYFAKLSVGGQRFTTRVVRTR